MYNNFIKAISEKKLVKISFDSQEKGVIERTCVPFDFGPSKRKMNPNPERYHFYDLDSPEKEHTLSILPEQLLELEILETTFDPKDYITWPAPYDWFIARDWGTYS
jgi:hypothetical protein